MEAFNRLPDEFTNEDVMHCFNLFSEGAARSKTRRLLGDHLIEKTGELKANGTTKSIFKKTGRIML